ncbi:MAG: YihY/virulence factor BrkB family protein [Saprospiraceae bacterium]|nr:YihY/virulence factor BrkB family protein [Saprospiraceae bacterium]
MIRYRARWVLLRRAWGRRWRRLTAWLKTHSFPGLFGVPIWDVGAFLVKELKKDDPFMRANAVAFSFFLSLFPAIMTLFTLLPYLPIYENFNLTLHEAIRGVMPGTAGDWLYEFLDDIATRERRGLLSFSTLLFLYFSTSGTATLMYSFEKQYPEIFKNRGVLMIRWIALWLTLLLATLVIFSIGLIIAGSALIHLLADRFHWDQGTTFSLDLLRWILVIMLFYASIALLYRYGAPTHRKFRFFSTGTTVATVLAIASSVLFSLYINSFGTYNKLYGSIGTVIALMLWLQINAFSIISGYELNTAILFHRVTARLKRESELAEKQSSESG